MKIKLDFVTNSSSSAFVVIFPGKVSTLEQVKKFIPEIDKAKQVFKDCLEQKPHKMGTKRSIDTIITEMGYGFFEAPGKRPDLYSFRNEQREEDIFCSQNGIKRRDVNNESLWWSALYEHKSTQRTIEAEEYAEKFINEHQDGYLYTFSYGDEDGQFFSEMEHGNTFRNLPHIKISHH